MNLPLSRPMARLVRSLARESLNDVRNGQPAESFAAHWAAANVGGPEALQAMLNHWCDATRAPHDPARPADAEPRTPDRWARRYLAARLAGDTTATTELIRSATRQQLADNAAALLVLAARMRP